MARHPAWRCVLAVILSAGAPLAAGAEDTKPPSPAAETVVVPQCGVVSRTGRTQLSLARVETTVKILDQSSIGERNVTAETTLTLSLKATGKRTVHCEIIVPVPSGAQLVPSSASETGSSTTGKKARRQHRPTILSNALSCNYCRTTSVRSGTPTLLEFYGYDLLRLSGVEIPPGGVQQVSLHYRNRLPIHGNRIDYILPRSELLKYRVPWTISATIRSRRSIAAVYSPSHPLSVQRDTSTGDVRISVSGDAGAEPGPFRLSWLSAEREGITGTVFACPDANNRDGYFLLLLAVAGDPPPGDAPKREVTVVIDRSASTEGKRLSQVRNITESVLDNLRPGEKFNIVTYNQNVQSFAKSPVGNTADTRKSAKGYLKRIAPRGGSNIHDALKTCLSQPTSPNLVPIVLFFTDGLPNSGKTTSELAIRKLVKSSNTANRRIYTFGVGVGLNTPLLQGIASETRGQATFVLPQEDIQKKVGRVVRNMRYPVLTDPQCKVTPKDENKRGKPTTISHVIPARLPDIFVGEKLVILGRFRGTEPAWLTVNGRFLGKPRTFRFLLDPSRATNDAKFVRRLWASRRIAQLVDAIRQSGAESKPAYAAPKQKPDPRIAVWSTEILQLTAEHGVMTEYTSFLSKGSTRTTFFRTDVFRKVIRNFDNRAVRSRAGVGSVSQEYNGINQRRQIRLNLWNYYFDSKMNSVRVPGVQQIGNSAFFQRDSFWVDGRLLNRKSVPPPEQIIRFGSGEYTKLLKRLADSGEQGALALDRKILLMQQKKPVLVLPPAQRPSQ